MITRADIDRVYGAIGPYLTNAYKPAPGERVAVVISGANMTAGQLDD